MNLDTTQKTKTNSFSRPSLSLEDSLNIANNIYNQISANAFDDSILAKILGNKSSNSSTYSRNKGSLSHYDLIEKIHEGKNKDLLKLTDNYINFLTEINDIKKYDILYSFFEKPAINKLIKEWFPDLNKINKEALIMQVIRNKKVDKNIAIEVAENFIRSYEYLKSIEPKNEIFLDDIIPEDIEPKNIDDKPYKNNADITYPLSNNKSILIRLPNDIKDLNESDLEDVTDILNLVLKKISKQLTLINKEDKV